MIYRVLFILVPKSQIEFCGAEMPKWSNTTHLKASERNIYFTPHDYYYFFLPSPICCHYCFLAGFHLHFSSVLVPPSVFSFLLVDFAGGYGAQVPPNLGQSAAGASFMLCSLNLLYTEPFGAREVQVRKTKWTIRVKGILKLYCPK